MKSQCCAFCGNSNGVMNTYYALPLELGGADTENNKIYLCSLHSVILGEIQNNAASEKNQDKGNKSLRLSLETCQEQRENLQNQFSELQRQNTELLSEVSKLKIDKEILLKQLDEAKKECEKNLSNSMDVSKGESEIKPVIEEFGENQNSPLDEDTVKLTLTVFDHDMASTASALGCSTDELNAYIKEHGLDGFFVKDEPNEVQSSDKSTIRSNIQSEQIDSDANLNNIASDQSDSARNDSAVVIAESSENPCIRSNEQNKTDTAHTEYEVKFLKDCSILIKALTYGVRFSSYDDPVVRHVGKEELMRAMNNNNWSQDLFRDPEQIQIVIDKTIAKEVRNDYLSNLPSTLEASKEFIIESLVRTNQSKDLIRKFRLSFLNDNPRAKFLSSKL
ncbi:hypothetical protein [Spongorhabdus nitratireducens]